MAKTWSWVTKETLDPRCALFEIYIHTDITCLALEFAFDEFRHDHHHHQHCCQNEASDTIRTLITYPALRPAVSDIARCDWLQLELEQRFGLIEARHNDGSDIIDCSCIALPIILSVIFPESLAQKQNYQGFVAHTFHTFQSKPRNSRWRCTSLANTL